MTAGGPHGDYEIQNDVAIFKELAEAAPKTFFEADISYDDCRKWDTEDRLKAVRDKVRDYYGTAAHCFRGAMGDYMSVRSMSDDQILEEAKRLHII